MYPDVNEENFSVLKSQVEDSIILCWCSASRGELAGEAYKAAGALFLSHIVKDQVSTFVVINFVVSIYALSAVLTKASFYLRLFTTQPLGSTMLNDNHLTRG